jgi:hypothetical protein
MNIVHSNLIVMSTVNSNSYVFFCSIAPNQNRPYFRNMYNDLEFSVPETGKMNLKFDPAPPAFNNMDKIDVGPDDIDQYFDEYEQIFFSGHMRQYYGMVKCI